MHILFLVSGSIYFLPPARTTFQLSLRHCILLNVNLLTVNNIHSLYSWASTQAELSLSIRYKKYSTVVPHYSGVLYNLITCIITRLSAIFRFCTLVPEAVELIDFFFFLWKSGGILTSYSECSQFFSLGAAFFVVVLLNDLIFKKHFVAYCAEEFRRVPKLTLCFQFQYCIDTALHEHINPVLP